MAVKLLAEFIGTFWLVFGGCGSAVFAAAFPYAATPERSVNFYGLGFLGVSLAFGLTLLTMAYAIGHISGSHINPAVSVGLWASGRFPTAELLPYIAAQVVAGAVAAGVVSAIAYGRRGVTLSVSSPVATYGYGIHSPGGCSLAPCAAIEVVLTFMFLFVILGATDQRAPRAVSGIAIGLTLTLIHLIA